MNIKEFISQFEETIQKNKNILIVPESFKPQFTAEKLKEIKELANVKFVPDDYLPDENTIYMIPPGTLEYKIEGDFTCRDFTTQ